MIDKLQQEVNSIVNELNDYIVETYTGVNCPLCNWQVNKDSYINAVRTKAQIAGLLNRNPQNIELIRMWNYADYITMNHKPCKICVIRYNPTNKLRIPLFNF